MKLLVVVDMQYDFTYGSLGSKEAIDIIENVNKKIKNFDGIVVYTRDTHNDNYFDLQEGKNLPVEHCKIGTKGHELVVDIANDKLPSKLKINELKDYYDKNSFGSDKLANDIKKCYNNNIIDEVEFIGLCTDICVVTNAMLVKGLVPEIKITVDSSCCAGVTVDKHNATLEVMKSCQISII